MPVLSGWVRVHDSVGALQGMKHTVTICMTLLLITFMICFKPLVEQLIQLRILDDIREIQNHAPRVDKIVI